MTESPVTQFAQYLKGLSEEDRKTAFSRAKMLALSEAPPEAFEPPIRSLKDYLAAPIEIPPVVVHPYMAVRGGLNATIGRSGKGKTVMSLNRILRWAAGAELFNTWHDGDGEAYMRPEGPLKILIVENEGAAGMFHRQIGLMTHAEGYLTDDQRALAMENVLVWGEGGYSGLKLDDPARLNSLRAGVEKWEPDLVFIEPFRSLWNGEENSATEMSAVVDALIGIAADYNCCCWIAHHEKKGGHGDDDKMSAARGSTVLENFVTVMEHFEEVKGGEYRELMYSKSRHGLAPNPARLEWDPQAWWYRHIPITDLEEAIVAALRDNADQPMSIPDMVIELDEKDTRLRPAVKRLADDGRIKAMPSQTKHGGGSTGKLYRLPMDDTGNGGLAL